MGDKYDDAIAYLTEHPDEIEEAWGMTNNHVAGCLFQYAAKDGTHGFTDRFEKAIGCLTMIRHRECMEAETPELTALIKADVRIPDRYNLSVETLPVFAEWQRRMDKELNRV